MKTIKPVIKNGEEMFSYKAHGMPYSYAYRNPASVDPAEGKPRFIRCFTPPRPKGQAQTAHFIPTSL